MAKRDEAISVMSWSTHADRTKLVQKADPRSEDDTAKVRRKLEAFLSRVEKQGTAKIQSSEGKPLPELLNARSHLQPSPLLKRWKYSNKNGKKRLSQMQSKRVAGLLESNETQGLGIGLDSHTLVAPSVVKSKAEFYKPEICVEDVWRLKPEPARIDASTPQRFPLRDPIDYLKLRSDLKAAASLAKKLVWRPCRNLEEERAAELGSRKKDVALRRDAARDHRDHVQRVRRERLTELRLAVAHDFDARKQNLGIASSVSENLPNPGRKVITKIGNFVEKLPIPVRIFTPYIVTTVSDDEDANFDGKIDKETVVLEGSKKVVLPPPRRTMQTVFIKLVGGSSNGGDNAKIGVAGLSARKDEGAKKEVRGKNSIENGEKIKLQQFFADIVGDPLLANDNVPALPTEGTAMMKSANSAGKREHIIVLPKTFGFGDVAPQNITCDEYSENFQFYRLDPQLVLASLKQNGIDLNQEVSPSRLREVLEMVALPLENENERIKYKAMLDKERKRKARLETDRLRSDEERKQKREEKERRKDAHLRELEQTDIESKQRFVAKQKDIEEKIHQLSEHKGLRVAKHVGTRQDPATSEIGKFVTRVILKRIIGAAVESSSPGHPAIETDSTEPKSRRPLPHPEDDPETVGPEAKDDTTIFDVTVTEKEKGDASANTGDRTRNELSKSTLTEDLRRTSGLQRKASVPGIADENRMRKTGTFNKQITPPPESDMNDNNNTVNDVNDEVSEIVGKKETKGESVKTDRETEKEKLKKMIVADAECAQKAREKKSDEIRKENATPHFQSPPISLPADELFVSLPAKGETARSIPTIPASVTTSLRQKVNPPSLEPMPVESGTALSLPPATQNAQKSDIPTVAKNDLGPVPAAIAKSDYITNEAKAVPPTIPPPTETTEIKAKATENKKTESLQKLGEIARNAQIKKQKATPKKVRIGPSKDPEEEPTNPVANTINKGETKGKKKVATGKAKRPKKPAATIGTKDESATMVEEGPSPVTNAGKGGETKGKAAVAAGKTKRPKKPAKKKKKKGAAKVESETIGDNPTPIDESSNVLSPEPESKPDDKQEEVVERESEDDDEQDQQQHEPISESEPRLKPPVESTARENNSEIETTAVPAPGLAEKAEVVVDNIPDLPAEEEEPEPVPKRSTGPAQVKLPKVPGASPAGSISPSTGKRKAALAEIKASPKTNKASLLVVSPTSGNSPRPSPRSSSRRFRNEAVVETVPAPVGETEAKKTEAKKEDKVQYRVKYEDNEEVFPDPPQQMAEVRQEEKTAVSPAMKAKQAEKHPLTLDELKNNLKALQAANSFRTAAATLSKEQTKKAEGTPKKDAAGPLILRRNSPVNPNKRTSAFEEEDQLTEFYRKAMEERERADEEKKRLDELEAQLLRAQEQQVPEETSKAESEEDDDDDEQYDDQIILLLSGGNPNLTVEQVKKKLANPARLARIIARLRKDENVKNILLQRTQEDIEALQACEATLDSFFSAEKFPDFPKPNLLISKFTPTIENVKEMQELRSDLESEEQVEIAKTFDASKTPHEESKQSSRPDSRGRVIARSIRFKFADAQRRMNAIYQKASSNYDELVNNPAMQEMVPLEKVGALKAHLRAMERIIAARKLELQELRGTSRGQKVRCLSNSASRPEEVVSLPAIVKKPLEARMKYKVNIEMIKRRGGMSQLEILERRYQLLSERDDLCEGKARRTAAFLTPRPTITK